MNEKSKYLTILCGEFNDGYSPLTRAKFWKLFHKCSDSIDNIIESEDQEVQTLIKRSGAVSFKVKEMEKMGIKITTIFDDDFPFNLFQKLGDKCPPLFYYCGDPTLNKRKYVGYVGSRSTTDIDQSWIEKMIDKNLLCQFGVVSGGAKGVDSISATYAIDNGGFAIEFLADGLEKKIKDRAVLKQLLDGKLLLYSAVSPFAKKYRNSFVVAAMDRNKFIYAQSCGTVVVKSDFGKGGTWAGATEALKNKWCKIYVWDKKNYQGNQALIKQGGTGLDDKGEKTIDNLANSEIDKNQDKKKMGYIQMSLL